MRCLAVKPSTANSANWGARRLTPNAVTENTKKPPVNRATSASTVKLTR